MQLVLIWKTDNNNYDNDNNYNDDNVDDNANYEWTGNLFKYSSWI